jgi:hypothetical protein
MWRALPVFFVVIELTGLIPCRHMPATGEEREDKGLI